VLRSNLDAIGAGVLARGRVPDGVALEHPLPMGSGTPLGQHLRIERLVRLVDGRQLYLANNVDPLWAHKKCWHCGNRYNPNLAQACSYCGTPLREQRFLATVRHDRGRVRAWESWLELRIEHPAFSTPVAAFYRDGLPVTVFPYYGERLLADQPAPLPAAALVPIAHRLAVALQAAHAAGARLAPFELANIVIMPDGTARFADLEADEVLDEPALSRHPERPILNDVRRLCGLMLGLADPADAALAAFLRAGVEGHHGPPRRFCQAIEHLHPDLAPEADEPRHAAFSDVGLVRGHNEDAWGWRRVEGGVVYALSDGMGGLEDGAAAARLAVDAAIDKVAAGLHGSPPSEAYVKQLVSEGVRAANSAVLGAAAAARRKMGCALVVLLVTDGGDAVVAHAGDSRAYLRRGPTLRRVTLDHSLVQAMVERGTITDLEARTHPKRNVVLNFIGQDQEIDVDVTHFRTAPGDRWLLCTDGVWGELADQEIRYYLDNVPEPRRCVQAIVRDVLAVGARDNLTLVVVDPAA
jgi:serine/threonine protein phosphatase PrpC